ncbi:MAG: hypothetical protein GY851_00430 [bacterium]|nr:hypothetical protein [bacterium]
MTDDTKSDLKAHYIRKVASVRVFATVCAVLLWMYLATQKQLPGEFNASMIAMVLTWYFKRTEDQKE